ncbi:MAG: hypothetical protein J5663_01000 [Bacteroidaceae bacterium]|nr:hypothetical protein [Bacteroidaceae bacterium]
MSEYKCGNCCGGMCSKGCSRHADKMNTYDWLADLPDNTENCDIVEVQFKPPRKGYFINNNKLPLEKGDIVAVEANPGHDIGTVTMTGRLVALQVKKANLKPDTEFKRIYRLAKPVDMDKFKEAKAREHETMIESRQIALSLGLKMKIGDVEYQGDGNKAIFYYIADERVDFRQLIKVLADRFRVRIEMKQIGARQEAGRIGGIGPCGRELCCATWMTNFVSVSTSAARFQDISLNPQKLAGQCAKLKCCLNYEVDQYVESLKRMPSKEMTLHTQDNEYYYFKSDILRHLITYSTDKHIVANEQTITAKRAFEVIQMNKEGRKPESLAEGGEAPEAPKSLDILEDNINRFDRKKKKKKKGQGGNGQNQQNGGNGQNNNNGNAPKNAGKNPQQENKGNGEGRDNNSNNNNDRRQRNNNHRDNRNRGRDNRPQGDNQGNRQNQGGNPQGNNQ